MHQRGPPSTKTYFSPNYSKKLLKNPNTSTFHLEHSGNQPKMSLPRSSDNHHHHHLQHDQGSATSSSSGGGRTDNNGNLLSYDMGKVEESDEDLFTVPDVEARPPAVNNNNNSNNSSANAGNNNPEGQPDQKRRRGRNPVDKEYRRLKRLLRNRVSAQQARERKKVYVNELESRAKELEGNNSKLEEKISTLVNENAMLRKVLLNTRPKVDHGSIEPKT